MISDAAIDIDWFAQDLDGNVVHFASGGGQIPRMVKDIDNNLLIKYFHSLPEKTHGVECGARLSQFIFLTGNELNVYLRDFQRMASRGLFSFDKSNLGNYLDNKYHLVCAPKIALATNELPESICLQLVKLSFNANNVSQVDLNGIL